MKMGTRGSRIHALATTKKLRGVVVQLAVVSADLANKRTNVRPLQSAFLYAAPLFRE